MDLSIALALSKQLHTALSEEIERARDERQLLRTLDAHALLERASRRQSFNELSACLQRKLSVEIARAAAASSAAEPTVSGLGPAGSALAQSLAEVRALAAALAELDLLNHVLAERSLKVVRSYTAALVARPSAYDRRGRTLGATGT